MCGICGIVDLQGVPTEQAQRLGSMVKSLHHRGPDQSGQWSDAYASLGHTRLSIIDVTDGQQPLSNEDGTIWITYNGEVYNFQELRASLLAKGHRFKTRTDTEVLVHLYEEEGIDFVHRLRGMFAFGIWDARNRAMYLARDQLGIKPLYYTMAAGRLVFGSEIKAILAAGVARSVREDALSDYLSFQYVPAPKTMFRDIYKLQPGHWLRLDRSGLCQQTQYWDLQPAEPLAASRPDIERELIERLSQSVRLQLVSDVPLGAFLSGGVDSSAVVAMMSRASQNPPVTVSVGFDEVGYNELPFAKRVAERYGTRHYEEIVRPDAVCVVEKLAWHYDEPFADYSSIPTYYVSLAARRHVTVALSGDGGDENFAGYRRYRFDLAERRLRRMLPACIRRFVLGPLACLYPRGDWLPRSMRAKVTLGNIASDPAEAYARSLSFWSESDKASFMAYDVARNLHDYRSSDIIRSYMDRADRSDLNQLLYTDIKTYLVDDILTKVDRASMAVSLEVRPPLLDHTFVEFAHRIQPSMKLQGGQGKAVFKSAMRPYLDQETLFRPKQGFTPPIDEWMRGPLREMVADLLLTQNAAHSQYLNHASVETALREHQIGARNHGRLLWMVLMFELWARKFLLPSSPV